MRRDIFQAIADPTRRAIITLIALQAMTPNAIAAHFDSSRQAVSKHLRLLTECELVTQETRGREIYYQLEIDKMKEIDNWLQQFREIWEKRFNQLDDLLESMDDKGFTQESTHHRKERRKRKVKNKLSEFAFSLRNSVVSALKKQQPTQRRK